MSRHRSGFRQVALLVAGSAALLFSCEGKQAADASAQDEAMMTMYSEDLSVVESKNGRKSYHFVTPMMEEYGLAREPYREFRKGVKIVTFNDDSVSSVDATLTANYAIYYTNRELWEARGNVVAETAGDRTLYTEQLFWNAKTKRIYSNVDSKIVQSDGVFYGEGLESDDALRDWRFRRMTGRMEVEVKPTADTTAAGSTRTGSTRTGSDAPSGDRASVPVAAGGAGTAAPRAVAGPAEAGRCPMPEIRTDEMPPGRPGRRLRRKRRRPLPFPRALRLLREPPLRMPHPTGRRNPPGRRTVRLVAERVRRRRHPNGLPMKAPIPSGTIPSDDNRAEP